MFAQNDLHLINLNTFSMKTFYLILMTLLIIVAVGIIAVVYGLGTGAPQEAAAAGLGCFVAILARMAQAAAHNCK